MQSAINSASCNNQHKAYLYVSAKSGSILTQGSGFETNTSASNIIDRWTREACAIIVRHNNRNSTDLPMPELPARAYCAGMASSCYVLKAVDVEMLMLPGVLKDDLRCPSLSADTSLGVLSSHLACRHHLCFASSIEWLHRSLLSLRVAAFADVVHVPAIVDTVHAMQSQHQDLLWVLSVGKPSCCPGKLLAIDALPSFLLVCLQQ